MNLKKFLAIALSVMMLSALFIVPASAEELDWGVTNVTVDEAAGTWKVELYINNPSSEFWYDAWYGIYDRSVTQQQLYEHRGNAGLSTWAYLKTSLKDAYGDQSAPSGTINFSIDHTNPTGLAEGNIFRDKYPEGLVAGCADLKVILFYSDGASGDGYKIAGEVNISLAEEKETDAPATDAPATDAPATDAPATDAPASDAPATDVPASDAPATDAPASDAPATDAPATNAPATEAPKEDKGGCGSAILAPVMLVTVLGGAVLSMKKR